MPIYMDVHSVPGVKARDVAVAHQHDLAHEQEFDCKCMTYWVDESRETVFCLLDAPHEEAVVKLHEKAHGLIPHKVIEVSPSIVESFLGRIYDPSTAQDKNGLKVFHEPSFRVLLLVQTKDPVLLTHALGKEKAADLLTQYSKSVREKIWQHGGRESECRSTDFIIAFSSAGSALAAAREIHALLAEQGILDIRLSLHAGEPVDSSDQLFGDTIRLADQLCSIANRDRIVLSNSMKSLSAKELLHDQDNLLFNLAPQDEEILQQLFQQLEENYGNVDFDAEDYAKAMAMSSSQLYRKTVMLTGTSPNEFLRDFRLRKARRLLKKNAYSISQIAFETGFSSPSYFTKCFKKTFDLLPMQYVDFV